MADCIYCRRSAPHAAFLKVEHVLPQSFGKFEQNLTLRDCVCDECNAYFGNELELHLARDTPDGFERFRLGAKDATAYRSVGRRSAMEFRVDSGPMTGVLVRQEVVAGSLVAVPRPSVGFGKATEGPWVWFEQEKLPPIDEIRALYEQGFDQIGFREVDDMDAVVAVLSTMGVTTSDVVQTVPAGARSEERVRLRTHLGDTFGRAMTKIALNYLASQYGAATARLSQFDVARRYARFGERPSTRVWSADATRVLPDIPQGAGHVLTLGWQPESETVLAQISFHNTRRYQVRLAVGGFATVPFKGCGHFFDLHARRILPLVLLW